MRGTVIGIVIGGVIGIMVGATIIAPRLDDGNAKPKTLMSDAAPKVTAETTAAAPRSSVPNPPAPVTVMSPAGPERPSVRWRMASAYADSLPQIGALATRVVHKLWEVSDGGIEIKFFEPGALVARREMFEAVASGTIDAAFSSPGLWSAKIPALNLFAAVPFGPQPSEYLAWIYFGGGRLLLNDIYHEHGIHSVLCGMTAPAAAGWFRRKFTTPEDLRGLRMRISGLGAKVLGKLGVVARNIDESDIFIAFETGDIDAAEFSMPAIDLKLGLNDMADHYYFPGWHRPATFFDLMIHKDSWDSLSKSRKSQIESVCGDNVRYGLAEGEALQYAALKELTAKGVRIHRWPRPILDAIEAAWRDVVAEQTSADADFRRVWSSLSAFRRDYLTWKELSRP